MTLADADFTLQMRLDERFGDKGSIDGLQEITLQRKAPHSSQHPLIAIKAAMNGAQLK